MFTRCCHQFCTNNWKFINKQELCRQCPPKRVKNSNIYEIENCACETKVMNITPVLGTEEVAWGTAIILRTVNDGVYICVCNVHNFKYDLWTKHAFFYDSHYKPLHQTECCGALIDNRADATICVLEYKDRARKKNMDFDVQGA